MTIKHKYNYLIDIGTNFNYEVSLVGGKGASLIKMKQNLIPVLGGVIITTDFFTHFIKNNINNLTNFEFPEKFKKDLLKRLDNIKDANSYIVRSSANIEDNEAYSFAGMFSSILDVKKSDLFDAIKKVYASLLDEKVNVYIKQLGISKSDIKMAVIIQPFINTDFAGVVFTADPITKNTNKIVVEIVKGLGENLVSGKKTPYSITIERDNFEKIKVNNKNQEINYKVVKEMTYKLLPIAMKIEKIFGAPVDIEFGFKNNEPIIFQARKITTME